MKEILTAIALGGNIGDSLTILNSAVETIAKTAGIEVISRSTWHKTKAIGPVQPDYLNGCIVAKTRLSAEDLLTCLQKIEDQFGRERKEKWGARTLDLDIIFYGENSIELPHLKIPHLYMRERLFVLMPLTEIAPDWLDPVTHLTTRELLVNLLDKVPLSN